MFMDKCTATELSETINGFNSNKASDIPVRVLKSCKHIISLPLSIFFNHIIDNSIFPDNLKLGHVTPIFIKGDCQQLENYRPITLLPIIGKLFEKIIYSRLYTLNMYQFGFRKSHSTSHAINHSIGVITEQIEKRKHVIGIFIALSKAFDTINHDILLAKLSNYGIRGIILQLIESYLKSRKQVTNFNGDKSELGTVVYGVPQGSVLGPLLHK